MQGYLLRFVGPRPASTDTAKYSTAMVKGINDSSNQMLQIGGAFEASQAVEHDQRGRGRVPIRSAE